MYPGTRFAENVPWHMTNTSEPHSDDMIEQANNPVSFDWMVKGVCGLSCSQMMVQVEVETFWILLFIHRIRRFAHVEISSDAS